MGVLTPKVYSHERASKIHVLDVAGGTGDIAFKIL
jgi:ubiquinone/menaquinone biosynthesis C-methylase UbiE